MADRRSKFRDKHVVLTGGSSGIGKALALRLAELGAELTLIARRANLLEQTRDEIAKHHPHAQVHLIAVDVSDADAVERQVGPHLDAHPPDMLINNAGIATPGRFLEQDLDEIRRHMDVNFFGMVHMTRLVVPRLVARGSGHVANVGSLLSVMGIYGYTAYAASKFAMQGFSECLRGELKPHGIQLTMLQPPDTDTPQHTAELEIMPAETKAIAGNVKMLSAESVADALLDGMAAGRFEVIPGLDGRLTVWAHRTLPGLVRWVCDGAQQKAAKAS
jgi:3-dehydrosphinganine reductase